MSGGFCEYFLNSGYDLPMSHSEEAYLTTRELADLLRIKERKVYELANSGEVPCVRVVGKLLFPRDQISDWIEAARSGPSVRRQEKLPPTVLGSHDPLLDWALKESGSALAAFFDGSRDGVKRLMQYEGVAAGMHIHESNDWNVDTVKNECGNEAVVLIEFARRSRGFIVAKNNPHSISTLQDVCKYRLAQRQAGAASQQMFEQMVHDAGVDTLNIKRCSEIARTEDELGMQVFDDKADVAFGLHSVATRLKLDYVPVMQEQFDLLVWRQAWFDQPFQTFLNFTKSKAFSKKAQQLGGYEIDRLGTVRLNAGS